jgi:hypothetical protein
MMLKALLRTRARAAQIQFSIWGQVYRLIPLAAIGNSALSNVQLRSLNPSNEFVELNTQLIRLTS